MSTDNDDIRALLQDAPGPTTGPPDLSKTLRRVRANVAQRDTLLFALVRVWSVLAALLAPIFAALATQQARTTLERGTPPRPSKPQS